MKFTDRKREIIQLISEGVIQNMYTLIKYFKGNGLLKYDINELQNKKKCDYESNIDKIEPYLCQFSGKKYKTFNGSHNLNTNPQGLEEKDYTNEEIEKCRTELKNFKIDNSEFIKIIEVGNKKYNYNHLDEWVYDYNFDGLIKDFIDVCEFLKEEGYIILKPKDINKDDLRLFFRMKNSVAEKEENLNIKELKINPEIQESIHSLQSKLCLFENMLDSRHIYKSKDIDYSDFIIVFDKEKYNDYEEYIRVNIWNHPKLDLFVSRNFMANDEYNFRKANNLTKIAIASSIILSILSIYLSLDINRNSSEFWSQNEIKKMDIKKVELEKINELIEVIKSQQKEIRQIKTILENEERVNPERIEEVLEKTDKNQYEIRKLINKMN